MCVGRNESHLKGHVSKGVRDNLMWRITGGFSVGTGTEILKDLI